MVKVLITGSAGFIGGYVVQDMLDRGYEVVGLDNFSKYGPVSHSYDNHPRFRFVEGDARDVDLVAELLADCDHFIAGAAMIGGISYFHTYADDIIAQNERISSGRLGARPGPHSTTRPPLRTQSQASDAAMRATWSATSAGMAKPIPTEPPEGEKIAVFTPITRP